MEFDNQVRVLAPSDSSFWRAAYFDAFVDTTGEHFQRYVATLCQFSDGQHYTGYLWDCLRRRTRITYQRFREEVLRHNEVFVLADDHSRDRVVGAPLWPYPSHSVISLRPQFLVQLLPVLPEDFYVFDSSASWTVGLTHEYDAKRRICFAVGIQS